MLQFFIRNSKFNNQNPQMSLLISFGQKGLFTARGGKGLQIYGVEGVPETKNHKKNQGLF
jgi:hypothetical protein